MLSRISSARPDRFRARRGPDAATFDAERDEAALSRLYAGIHYPSDINVGKEHGARIGGYTVAFAREDGAD